jgi:hypothetical protein
VKVGEKWRVDKILFNLDVLGGKVRKVLHMKTLAAVVLLGAGLVVAGCKSVPELTATHALALVQAKYDQQPAVGADIQVDDTGMRQGIGAKLWERTTIYPNKYWADFKLTDAGKKAVKLPGGGDVIQWRPSGLDDKNYTYRMTTIAANPLKAHDMGELQDEMVPGADTAKSGKYTEGLNLTGVPDVLQDIAHNPGNRLSAKRQADFTYEGGSWKLHSIQ